MQPTTTPRSAWPARPLAPQASSREVCRDLGRLQVRFLGLHDLDALLVLEQQKWHPGQQASRQALAQRIRRHPDCCIGAFDRSGRALASLFLKPLAARRIRAAASWEACVQADSTGTDHDGTLFGISLSSADPAAVQAIFRFFWPHALRQGWREVYLGSPMPGWRAWRHAHPDAELEDYARRRRANLPLDPQLRYYHARGFRSLVAVKENYFPHAASMDTAALLRARIPGSFAAPLWRRLPLSWTERLSAWMERLL